jgi:hypothetical protein
MIINIYAIGWCSLKFNFKVRLSGTHEIRVTSNTVTEAVFLHASAGKESASIQPLTIKFDVSIIVKNEKNIMCISQSYYNNYLSRAREDVA